MVEETITNATVDKAKTGYKKTKLGWIPEEWEEQRLENVVSHFKSGNGITSNEISDEGLFPVYGGNGLRGYTSKSTHIGSYVLIGRQGALCGNIQFVSGENYISEHAIAMQVSKKNDLGFWYYKLDFLNLNRLSESSAQPGLSVVKLLRLKVFLPPLPEQQKIATILSTWDEAIDTLHKLIAKKLERKKGLMQQLLTGKKRFDGFREEWKEIRLGDIGKFLKGKGVPKSEIVDEGLPCLTYGELYKHHHNVIRQFVSYISENIAEGSVLLKYGDILFAGSGETLEEIGKSAAFIESYPAYAGGDIIILRQSTCDPEYLGYLLNHDVSRRQLHKLGQGHSVVHIYSSGLSKVVVSIPNLKEQQKIASVLSAADAEIEKLQTQLNKLQEQKKGLMQKLLTGEVRVKITAL